MLTWKPVLCVAVPAAGSGPAGVPLQPPDEGATGRHGVRSPGGVAGRMAGRTDRWAQYFLRDSAPGDFLSTSGVNHLLHFTLRYARIESC